MRKTKQEAARDVDREEAVATREVAATDSGAWKFTRKSINLFLERTFHRLIQKWGLTKIAAIIAVRRVTG